jgi:SAM-dependent MidA family methyltransferase
MNRGRHPGNVQLVKIIREQIGQSPHQAIPFQDYMELCLYHPEYGYYLQEQIKVGKKGDFYTSSSIGSIMGEMLASKFNKFVQGQKLHLDKVHLVEWGGGTGQLAKHLLDELRDAYPELYERTMYTSIEKSEYHRQVQKDKLSDHLDRICWQSAREWFQYSCRKQVFIYANELLDAFPVHRIEYTKDRMYEIYVGWDDGDQRFHEKLILLEEGAVSDYIDRLEIQFEEGQRAEVNLAADRWIQRMGEWMESGEVVIIDYGDAAKEIYAAHRMQGTLMCYRQHQAEDNPYEYVGEQDITAHVNFTSCIQSGWKAGFTNDSLTDQKTFLLQEGIMDKLQDHGILDPFHPIARKNRAIRQLLWSDQMSELFKVLTLSKEGG